MTFPQKRQFRIGIFDCNNLIMSTLPNMASRERDKKLLRSLNICVSSFRGELRCLYCSRNDLTLDAIHLHF